MTYAITQTCCNDAACVAVCPVNCIHPTPQERAFGSTEMLHIDPRACIDCGACADACPVDAIFPVDSLRPELRPYAEMNAAWFEGAPEHEAPEPEAPNRETPEPGTRDGGGRGPGAAPREEGGAASTAPAADPAPNFHLWGRPEFTRVLPADFAPLRIAVVGTGPAGMYAAQDLLLHTNAEITLIDRLPVAGGLLRHGVAPDHPATRRAGEAFARFHSHPRVRMYLGVQVGRDLSAQELAAHHDAVVYAVGASSDRPLGLPGEESPRVLPAARLVAWYNAHPDVAPDAVDLSGVRRVAVVGSGNVALDTARILVCDPASLAATDIADHALAALRDADVREVVVLGRRGPEDAACTRGELLALTHLPGVDLVVDDHDPRIGAAIAAARPGSRAAVLRGLPRGSVDPGAPPSDRRRIVLRFHSAPTDLRRVGTQDGILVTGATGASGDRGPHALPADLVVRAVGYRGEPVEGLPFDAERGTVPHQGGRVAGMPGTYVVGWIKRGPSGGIGANRACAAETVGSLLTDAVGGMLPSPRGTVRAFDRLVRRRAGRVVDARGLRLIDRAELARGRADGRPRARLATVEELLAAARGPWRPGR
ncbi:FAD-dependent oxidoreductase [Streptomyces sp. NPDC006984]|uniref:FAD-dependent oxidoreductase n=1 Tax=Streptomyces sp. NPDC006984 TaxID=3155463 RepID=UPI0033FE5D0B